MVLELVALVFGLSWPVQLWVAFGDVPEPFATALLAIAGVVPSVVALALTRGRAARGLRGPWALGWIIAALLVPPAFALVAGLLGTLVGGPAPTFGAPAILVALVVPLGEELGWRGVLYPELRARWGVARAAIVSGAIWSLWHLPTAFYGDGRLADFAPYALTVAAMGVVMAWVYERSKSLPAIVAFHAGLNLHVVHADGAPARVAGAMIAILLAIAALRDLRRR